MVKSAVMSARHWKAGSELATAWSGRQCLAPVEKDRERGRSTVEGWMRCGFLQGSWCAFYRAERGAPRRWRAVMANGGEGPSMPSVSCGD
jgi:hypothetical protein